MAQWGKDDASSNAVLWAPTSVKLAANSTNRNNLYGNSTVNSFVTGQKVGMFGVDATEAGVSSGGVISYTVTFAGSGYSANAAVTLSGGGGSGATANTTKGATGRISSVNANQVGTSYESSPSVAIAAPTAQNVVANTNGVSNTNNVILLATANSIFLAGDRVYYTVPTGNTAIGGLTGNAFYYVTFSNSTSFAVSTTSGGSNADIAEDRTTATGEVHTFTGETATARSTVGGGKNKGAHAGWVLRREGTGGRAGRVHYETLVAMGSITGDGSDDSQLPDS